MMWQLFGIYYILYQIKDLFYFLRNYHKASQYVDDGQGA